MPEWPETRKSSARRLSRILRMKARELLFFLLSQSTRCTGSRMFLRKSATLLTRPSFMPRLRVTSNLSTRKLGEPAPRNLAFMPFFLGSAQKEKKPLSINIEISRGRSAIAIEIVLDAFRLLTPDS
jgi:hypothetical protein